jgi:uncharacterized protein
MAHAQTQQLISTLGLSPHPEGGYYRETYRAEATFAAGRSVCTAIYYLLEAGDHSALHRIDADEIWHFYQGDPLLVVELVADAAAKVTVLSATNPQHVVRAGTWFGALPAPGSVFSLCGCTVSPGFEFAHFELANRRELLAQFPLASELITRLTAPHA